MEVIRKIVEVKDHHIELDLPEEFTSKEAEVIVLSHEEDEKKMKTFFDPAKFFGAISKETAMEMLKDVEQSRGEWERDF